MPRRTVVTAAASAAVALLAAACGSSGSSGSTGSTATTSGAAHGSPLNVYAIGIVSSPAASYPEAADAVQGYFKRVNAHGGIQGHPVNVTVCNDQFNPNVATACARQAIQGNAFAVVAFFTAFGAAINPLFQQAQIADVGPELLTPADDTSAVTFATSGGGTVNVTAVGDYLAKEKGCKNIAAFSGNSPPQEATAMNAINAAKKVGSNGFLVAVPVDTPDYSPYIASAVSKGADCVYAGLASQEFVKFQTALAQSGKKLTVGAQAATVPQATLASLGSKADGVIVVSSYNLSSSVRSQVTSDIKSVDPSQSLSDFAVNAWTGAYVIDQVAKNLKTLTSASLLSAIGHAKVDTPTAGVIDFGTPGPTPSLSHVFNTKAYVFVAHSGSLSLASANPVDVRSILVSEAGS